MDREILEDLYMFLVDEGVTKKEELYKMLRGRWTIITRGIADNGEGEIDIDTFTTKVKAQQWIAEQVLTGMLENYGFDIECILNSGRVIRNCNEYTIKVSF